MQYTNCFVCIISFIPVNSFEMWLPTSLKDKEMSSRKVQKILTCPKTHNWCMDVNPDLAN